MVYIWLVKLKLFFLLAITLSIFQSCCSFGSGRGCGSDDYGQAPDITINFKDYSTTNFRVAIYTVENNTIVDSAIKTDPVGGHCIILPYKKEHGGDINEVRAKKFIIRRNNKSDTISQLNCTYEERVVKCDKCNTNIKNEYTNFTFLYKNQVLSARSLTIDY